MKNINIEPISNNINSLHQSIEKSIKWINAFLKAESKDKSYAKIVRIRRQLKKIGYAITQNPSSAMYGESQVGKSYLIKNILSLEGEEFTLYDPEKDQVHNFLEDINPKGDGVEATSVVTRFSTSVQLKDSNYPILVKILTGKDVALFLIDSCFSELRDTLTTLKKDEVNALIADLKEKYSESSYSQEFLTEDDFYDIQDYIEENFPTSLTTGTLKDETDFWKVVPKLIKKVPPQEWYLCLHALWGQNEIINETFNKLIAELQKLDFVDVAYCKFAAVLRKNGTLLDVIRLHNLNNPDSYREKNFIQDVELLCNDRKISINKNYLCALTKEVVFKLDEKLEEQKPFLKTSDLLDFPGARSRKEVKEEKIREEIPNVILRGKVGYIFNKYSDEYLISNLLFCNRSLDINTPFIPRLLNTWISKYIGKTPAEREIFLKNSKVPPLFIIYTWFNVDLAYSGVNDKDKESISDKWEKRFTRIFEQGIVTKNYEWDKNWTTSQPFFQNNYMLRDQKLSEEKSNIFQGFAQFKEERVRVDPIAYGGNYWNDLKESFVEFPFVKKHFNNPEQAWDDSATMNNDGSLPIIRNLNFSTDNNVRIEKFVRECNELLKRLNSELSRHFHDDASDKLIVKAVQKAGKIHLNLDTSFGRDPYFFGNLMQKFLISESEIFNFFRDKINDLSMVKGADISVYIATRMRNQKLSTKASFDENMAVLMRTYKMTAEEVTEYMETQDIDLNELFYGGAKRLKSNSIILSEDLENYYVEKYLDIENFSDIISKGFDSESIEDLLNNVRVNYKKTKVTQKIAETIRDYVDRYDKIEKAEEMIADISAATINNFINSMGVTSYSKDELDNIKKASSENELGLIFDNSNLEYEPLDDDDLSELFETMDRLHEILNEIPLDEKAIRNVPSFSQYTKWSNLMKISFVANCDIPTYDILANNQLGDIIGGLDEHSFETPNMN